MRLHVPPTAAPPARFDGATAEDTNGEFTFSIVVSDNDSNQSARAVVEEFAKTATIDIAYCVETQPNIALARNQAVRRAAENSSRLLTTMSGPRNNGCR